MNFVFSEIFRKSLKQLGKKNTKLKSDLEEFLQKFDPKQGDIIQGTGGIRKIRMKISGKGKSGGYRILYYYKNDQNVFFLLAYSKTDKDDFTEDDKKRIMALVAKIDKGE